MTLKDLLSVLNDGANCVSWNDNTTPNEPPLFKGRTYEARKQSELLPGIIKAAIPTESGRIDIFITL